MEIEKTADTVNIAIDEALKELNVTIDKIDYKILQYPSKGFLGLFKKPAKVIISLKDKNDYLQNNNKLTKSYTIKDDENHKKNDKKEQKSDKNEQKNSKKEQKNDKNFKEKDNFVKKNINIDAPNIAKNFLNEIFEKMNIEIDISANLNEKNALIIDLVGDDIGVIIGKRGQTLDSLQYLVNLVINKGEYPYMPIYIDTQDYRERRKQSLEMLAINLSKKAKKIGKNVVLEPMNPYERRVIHAKLQSNQDVKTYSEGEEPFRYVVISPRR